MAKPIMVAIVAMTITGCGDHSEPASINAVATTKPSRLTPLQLEGLRSVLNRCRIPGEQRQCVQHELRRLGPEDRDAVKRAVPGFMLRR